jgi:predicted small lipoprotein YifL
MNIRLIRLAVFAAALLAVLAVVSACGKRGDPVRPRPDPAAEPASQDTETVEDPEELF